MSIHVPMRSIALAALLACSAQSHAAVTGIFWRQVNNTVGAPGADAFAGAQWNALDQYTFDLMLRGDAGQRINGINMGNANPPTLRGLYTNGVVFNHSFGGNVQSTIEFPPFNAMAYDTYVDLGGTPTTPVITFVGSSDLSGGGGAIRAHWQTANTALLDANGEMRIMRVTVGLPAGSIAFGGGFILGTGGLPGLWYGNPPQSSLEVELGNGNLRSFVIGNAFELVPAPGAVTLLGVAGLAAARRRR